MGFNDSLGMRIGAGGAAIELEPSAAHEAVPGAVHFAVLTTLAEVAAAHAASAPVVPAHVSVQLLRRAVPGATLVARGRVLKAGRTLIFAEGAVTQEGELVAQATITFARV
jgi:acyl-CoA thioesterase